MNTGFFVMKLWRTGNIGSDNIAKVKANPKNGYQNYEEAKIALQLMFADKNNWEVKTNKWYEYSIMELFS